MANKDKHKPKAVVEAPVEIEEVSLEAALGLDEEEVTEEVVEEVVETEDAEEVTEDTEYEAVVDNDAEEEVLARVEAARTESVGVIVKDDAGVPMFKRMAPTSPAAEPARKERTKPSYKPRTKQTAHETSANAALLTFPNDRYGIAKDIKKAMISAASRIAGDESKKDLVLEVVDILLKHVEAKYRADRAYRVALAERHKDA